MIDFFKNIFIGKAKQNLPLSKLLELTYSKIPGIDQDLLKKNLNLSLDRLEREMDLTSQIKDIMDLYEKDEREFTKEQIEGMIEVLKRRLEL